MFQQHALQALLQVQFLIWGSERGHGLVLEGCAPAFCFSGFLEAGRLHMEVFRYNAKTPRHATAERVRECKQTCDIEFLFLMLFVGVKATI